MTYLDTLPDCDELLADRKAAIALRNMLGRHPDPQDPHHPIDVEAQADADADAFADMLTEVRSLLSKAETQQKAGRTLNARLALSDAASDINEWLENTK